MLSFGGGAGGGGGEDRTRGLRLRNAIFLGFGIEREAVSAKLETKSKTQNSIDLIFREPLAVICVQKGNGELLI